MSEEAEPEEDDDTDDEAIAMYLEQDDESDDDEEVTQETRNPHEETLIKLKDKISLLKYRCEAGLGITLAEKSYKMIKSH